MPLLLDDCNRTIMAGPVSGESAAIAAGWGCRTPLAASGDDIDTFANADCAAATSAAAPKADRLRGVHDGQRWQVFAEETQLAVQAGWPKPEASLASEQDHSMCPSHSCHEQHRHHPRRAGNAPAM